MSRPPFLQSLLDSWQLSLDQKRPFDLIPYWLLISTGVAVAVAYQLPTEFWDTKQEVGAALMGAVLTFNGIVMALSWSAFAKIYEIIGAGSFAAHLRKHRLLNHYLHFVAWCQGSQVLAISCTASSILSFWLLEPWASRVAVGASIASTIYAVRQGVSTSEAMQDLIWRKSEFDEHTNRRDVKPVETNAK